METITAAPRCSIASSAPWALPFKGNRLVAGWQLSGIVSSMTGLPFTVFQGLDSLGFGTGVVNPRPNFVGNGNPVTGNPGGIYFDPNAFTLAPIGNANAGKILYDVGNPRQIQFALKLTF